MIRPIWGRLLQFYIFFCPVSFKAFLHSIDFKVVSDVKFVKSARLVILRWINQKFNRTKDLNPQLIFPTCIGIIVLKNHFQIWI